MTASESFDHLILTRFNVTVPNSSHFDKGLDDQWLAHRMILFRRFCFPSVAAQSVTNFKWIIMLHPDTPAAMRRELTELQQSFPQMHIFEAARYNPRVLRRMVRRHASAEFLITSRLDNDDALAVDYVKTVQDAFRPVEIEFINFPDIACYDSVKRTFLTRVRDSNPFMSLVEKRSGAPRTVLAVRHRRAQRAFPVRTIRTRTPMGLAVAHERNVTNRASGREASTSEMRKRFAVHVEQREEAWGAAVRRLASRLRRRLATSVRKLRRRRSVAGSQTAS